MTAVCLETTAIIAKCEWLHCMSLLSDLLRTCAIFKDDVAKPFKEERLVSTGKVTGLIVIECTKTKNLFPRSNKTEVLDRLYYSVHSNVYHCNLRH